MSTHGNRKYQWEAWLGGPKTHIVRGVHYHCSQSSIVGAIRNAASQRKLRVRITDLGDSVVIKVVHENTHTDTPALAT